MAFELEEHIEALTLRVFLKSLELLGGTQKLVQTRATGWLSSLLLASYTVVLKEEYLKSEQEIAQRLRITPQTVKNILRSEPLVDNLEEVFKSEGKDLNIHTAGSIAKLAYRLIKDQKDHTGLCLEFSRRTAGALGIAWAKILLRRLEEKDFPVQSAQNLKEKLGKVWLSGRSAQEVLEELDYPIHTPIELIEKIKENLRMYGLE